jgi:formate dehydrogenase assembly factor FdhD
VAGRGRPFYLPGGPNSRFRRKLPMHGRPPARMWLKPEKAALIAQRRRNIAGPTGCGLCGIDSITEAIRPAAIVPAGRSFSPREIMTAVAAVAPL